jgi:GNAT superfamily N-acetyltransferase
VLQGPRRLTLRLTDTQVIERPDLLQVITPSLRAGGLNEVAFCDFEPGHADEEIDLALARFAQARVSFRWGVFPDCRPLNLAQRLTERGLVSHTVQALFRSTEHSPPTPRAGLELTRVDERSLPEFSRVMAEGWGLDPEPLRAVHRASLTDERTYLSLARVSGVGAGVATAVLSERAVLLLGAVVLPQFRRRGVYQALVSKRLLDARAVGRSLAVTHAMATTSAPILKALGFSEAFQFESFGPRYR